MTNRLGLAACVVTVFTVAGLVAPLHGGPDGRHTGQGRRRSQGSLRQAQDLGWIVEEQTVG